MLTLTNAGLGSGVPPEARLAGAVEAILWSREVDADPGGVGRAEARVDGTAVGVCKAIQQLALPLVLTQ